MNLEIFKLDSQEVAVLHALQKEFISKDIEETVDPTESKIKERWFKDWQKSFPNDVKNKGIFSDLFTSFKNDSVILKLGKLSSEKQKIILFELSIFLPYFKLKERQGNVAALKSIYSQKKKEEQILNPYIKEITDELKDVTFAEIKEAHHHYFNALKNILPAKYRPKSSAAIILGAAVVFAITGGLSAPIIGGAIGGVLGLSGAAATSAGLAMLGGGALTIGGFGMAGGTFVIIGGGALLGSLMGFSISEQLFKDSNFVLSQLAKIETILNNFYNWEPDLTYEIIKALREITNQMEQAPNKKDYDKTKEIIESAISRFKEHI